MNYHFPKIHSTLPNFFCCFVLGAIEAVELFLSLEENINLLCLQALAQCEMTLHNLGVVKVTTDDTAGAAQVNVFCFFLFCLFSFGRFII